MFLTRRARSASYFGASINVMARNSLLPTHPVKTLSRRAGSSAISDIATLRCICCGPLRPTGCEATIIQDCAGESKNLCCFEHSCACEIGSRRLRRIRCVEFSCSLWIGLATYERACHCFEAKQWPQKMQLPSATSSGNPLLLRVRNLAGQTAAQAPSPLHRFVSTVI